MLERCPVLDWAASGAMALTGHAGGAPTASPAAAFGLLGEVGARLGRATGAVGTRVGADPAELIAGRAALTGFTRQGRVSAGGSSRLLRAADGWCAVTLSRDADVAAVPAILGVLGLDTPSEADPWGALEAAALAGAAGALADAAQLLGVPAAALPANGPASAGGGLDPAGGPDPAWPPWGLSRVAAPDSAARLDGAVVVDLSSMWAGPLCARLLGQAGARVIKVESPDRPDGARAGSREFFDWLHAGHRSAAVDFRAGRDTLAALLAAADVVIEASRPRALAGLGLAPETLPHKNGQVWLSITGYGRGAPDRVAFGDDAAVAGGLVGWTGGGRAGGPAEPGGSPEPGGTREPVFCADAVADPLAGVCGALAVCESLAQGGGHLIDLSMRAVAAAFAAAPAPAHGPHEVRSDGTVTCGALGRTQEVAPPRRPAPAGRAAELGADTASVLDWLASRPASPATASPTTGPPC
jgi:CoA transferase family III